MHVYAHINLCTKCEMRNIHNYIVVRMCDGIPLLCVIARKQIRNPHKYFHIPSICSAQVCANAQKTFYYLQMCAHTNGCSAQVKRCNICRRHTVANHSLPRCRMIKPSLSSDTQMLTCSRGPSARAFVSSYTPGLPPQYLRITGCLEWKLNKREQNN